MYMFGYVKVFTYICQEGMQIGQHINSNIHVCTQFAKIINTTSFLGLFGKAKQQQQKKTTSSHLKKKEMIPSSGYVYLRLIAVVVVVNHLV